MEIDVKTLNQEFKNRTVTSIITWVYSSFDCSEVKFSTSFGAENMVAIHLLKQLVNEPRIFTIDTGHNLQETYDVWQEVVNRYKLHIDADREKLDVFFATLRYFSLDESLGGVESLIESPWYMSHMSMSERARRDAGITSGIVRVSVGLEHVDDLIEDLGSGLKAI